MTVKHIRRSVYCKECGHVTYRGYDKYTCNGCGLPIKKGKGKHQMDMIDFSVKWKSESNNEDNTNDSKNVHFHSLECMREWLYDITADDIEKFEYMMLWFHDTDEVRRFVSFVINPAAVLSTIGLTGFGGGVFLMDEAVGEVK